MRSPARRTARALGSIALLAFVGVTAINMPLAEADAAPTTTQLATVNPTAQYKTAIALQATVIGTAPTGSVTFLDASTVVGSTTPGPTGVAQLVVSTLAVGTHSLTASYGGDANNAPSASAPLTVTVFQKSHTDLLIYAQPKGSTLTPSTPLVMVANLMKASPIGTKFAPTGTVTFTVDGVTTVRPVAGLHHANLSFPNGLPLGIHHATAHYNGDALYQASTSPTRAVNVRVDLATSISATPDPVVAGGDVQYTVTVTNNGLVATANVQVSESLPPGTTFVSANAPGGCTGTGPVVCTLGTLAVHTPGVATIVVHGPSSVPAGGTITDTATATPGINNVAGATTSVVSSP